MKLGAPAGVGTMGREHVKWMKLREMQVTASEPAWPGPDPTCRTASCLFPQMSSSHPWLGTLLGSLSAYIQWPASRG